MSKSFGMSVRGFFGAMFIALLVIGVCVVWYYWPDYSDEIDLDSVSDLQIGQAYSLDAGDYEIGRQCGAFVIGDRYDITKSHKTTYWTVSVGDKEILVSVTDKQADAFSNCDSIKLHGVLTAMPELLDFHPGPEVEYCLTCPGVDSEAVAACCASLGMVAFGLLLTGFIFVQAGRKEEITYA